MDGYLFYGQKSVAKAIRLISDWRETLHLTRSRLTPEVFFFSQLFVSLYNIFSLWIFTPCSEETKSSDRAVHLSIKRGILEIYQE